MPTYKFKNNQTGEVLEISGNTKPTPLELNEIVSARSKAPAAPQQAPKTLGGFAGNVLKSAGSNALDIGKAVVNVANPNLEKNTLWNLGKLGVGAAELAIPGEQGLEKYPRAVGSFYKDRYGGAENIKNTLYNDPVGALLDVATVASAGAGGVKALAKGASLAGKAETAGKIGNIASKLERVEKVTNPINVATGTAKAGAKGVSKVFSKGVDTTTKVAKPAGTMNFGERTAAKISEHMISPSTTEKLKFQKTVGKPLGEWTVKNKLLETPAKNLEEVANRIAKINDDYYAAIASKDAAPFMAKGVSDWLRKRADQGIKGKGANKASMAEATDMNVLRQYADFIDQQYGNGTITGTELAKAKSIDINTMRNYNQVPEMRSAAQIRADALREFLNDNYNDKGLKAIGQKEKELIAAQEVLERNANKTKSLRQQATTGFAGGALAYPMGIGFPGMVAAGIAATGLSSPPALSTYAKLFSKGGKAFGNIAKSERPIVRAASKAQTVAKPIWRNKKAINVFYKPTQKKKKEK